MNIPGTYGHRAAWDALIDSLRPGAKKASDPMNGIQTEYAGVRFRSRLEAGWAVTFDHYGIRWEYEQELVDLPSSGRYLPDFRLPDLATVMEVKGPHLQRLNKAHEYAIEVRRDTIVLIGWPELRLPVSPGIWVNHMQWSDGLDRYPIAARFTMCAECRAYQWCRLLTTWQDEIPPDGGVSCRACGAPLGKMPLYGSGEAAFYNWRDEPYKALPAGGGD